MQKRQNFIARIVSLSLICLSFAQVSTAGVIGTEFLVDQEARQASLARMEVLLAREDIAQQFAAQGVSIDLIQERLNAMTSAELLELQGRVEESIAGSGVLGLVGAVFVVLLILELVGVTDIFKAV